MNADYIKNSTENKAYAVDSKGITHFMGVYEFEGTYDRFATLGAKKYAYTYPDDDSLHITVAGLSKNKGGEWLTKHGGMKKFRMDTIIPAGNSGRTVSEYIDHTCPYYLLFKNEKILTGSAIAIYETSYTFSITSEYQQLLADIEGVVI